MPAVVPVARCRSARPWHQARSRNAGAFDDARQALLLNHPATAALWPWGAMTRPVAAIDDQLIAVPQLRAGQGNIDVPAVRSGPRSTNPWPTGVARPPGSARRTRAAIAVMVLARDRTGQHGDLRYLRRRRADALRDPLALALGDAAGACTATSPRADAMLPADRPAPDGARAGASRRIAGSYGTVMPATAAGDTRFAAASGSDVTPQTAVRAFTPPTPSRRKEAV